MAGKKKVGAGAVIKGIFAFIVVAVLAFVLAVIVYFTNGMTEDFKTFYVEYNGTRIVSQKSHVDLARNKENKFYCKFTFDAIMQEGTKGYTVKVLPNDAQEVQFDFIVDGRTVAFSDAVDLSSTFGIKQEADHFTVNIPKRCTIEDILQAAYPGKEVIIPETVLKNETVEYYRLIVAAESGNCVYQIAFNIDPYIAVERVDLVPEGVIA